MVMVHFKGGLSTDGSYFHAMHDISRLHRLTLGV